MYVNYNVCENVILWIDTRISHFYYINKTDASTHNTALNKLLGIHFYIITWILIIASLLLCLILKYIHIQYVLINNV